MSFFDRFLNIKKTDNDGLESPNGMTDDDLAVPDYSEPGFMLQDEAPASSNEDILMDESPGLGVTPSPDSETDMQDHGYGSQSLAQETGDDAISDEAIQNDGAGASPVASNSIVTDSSRIIRGIDPVTGHDVKQDTAYFDGDNTDKLDQIIDHLVDVSIKRYGGAIKSRTGSGSWQIETGTNKEPIVLEIDENVAAAVRTYTGENHYMVSVFDPMNDDEVISIFNAGA